MKKVVLRKCFCGLRKEEPFEARIELLSQISNGVGGNSLYYIHLDSVFVKVLYAFYVRLVWISGLRASGVRGELIYAI